MEPTPEAEPPTMDPAATIRLTANAVKAAQELVASQPEYAAKPLRLYLDGKGCDGFYYGVTFSQQEPDDLVWADDGFTVVTDPRTFVFVSGSVIDWVDDERGRGFLVDNPQQKRFRGKFFKKSVWQQRLTELNAQQQ